VLDTGTGGRVEQPPGGVDLARLDAVVDRFVAVVEREMDELAHAVGVDPLEFRLRNIKEEKAPQSPRSENGRQPQFEPARLRAVLEAAAEKFGWGKNKPGNGAGYGIAGGFEKGGYVACAAEVEVTLTGQVKILRVVEAWDSGPVVNPEGLRNIITGAIIQGIGGALFEAVQFRNGRILNPHFADYRVPRFADVPKIDVVLIDRKDRDPFGAGETPIVGIAPAVAEAIFGATGKRLRDMPLAPNGVDCGCEVKGWITPS
jgi:isoquinoline 1-oxidoreductase